MNTTWFFQITPFNFCFLTLNCIWAVQCFQWKKNRYYSESSRWHSTISHWESFSTHQKSGGHGHCEFFSRGSSIKEMPLLSIFWKPNHKVHHSSRSKVFRQSERFWNRVQPHSNFVLSKLPSFAVHPWTIYPSCTKTSVFRGLNNNAVMECHWLGNP